MIDFHVNIVSELVFLFLFFFFFWHSSGAYQKLKKACCAIPKINLYFKEKSMNIRSCLPTITMNLVGVWKFLILQVT